VLLVVTYSKSARRTLRNVCSVRESAVVRRFGRAALFEATELGAFLALRLRARHGDDVELRRVERFNEFRSVSESVRAAARAYEDRDHDATPYAKFAAGTDHPSAEAMAEREL
jgi:hypothetical protein